MSTPTDIAAEQRLDTSHDNTEVKATTLVGASGDDAECEANVSAPFVSQSNPKKPWWKLEWVSDRWRRVLYSSVGVALLIGWFAVIFAFGRDEANYQDSNFAAFNRSSLEWATDPEGTWILRGVLQQFNPETRTLTVTWSILSSKTDSSEIYFIQDWPVAIYRDHSLIPEKKDVDDRLRNVPEYANSTKLRVDTDSAEPIATVGAHGYDRFQTDITMGQAQDINAWTSWSIPLIGYPFEQWYGYLILVANNLPLAMEYNASYSFGVNINGAYLLDSLINWRITLESSNSCYDLINSNISSWSPGDNGCELAIIFWARRPILVSFSVVSAVLVNWLSTILIFFMTCEGVVVRRNRMINDSQLLAVCFTALFALPTLRSILPGAPEFGCLIDLVGIIPNVLIVSLCTSLLAVATLRGLHVNKPASFAEKKADHDCGTE